MQKAATGKRKFLLTKQLIEMRQDQYVLKNLEINVDGKTNEEKMENTKLAYKKIVEDVYNKLKEESIKNTIKEFREFFPEFNFSDVKILDFILWNNRD